MKVRNVLVGVAFVVILYLIYIYAFKKNRSSLIPTQETTSSIKVKNIGNDISNAYSMWIYVSEWKQGNNFKHIMTRQSENYSSTKQDANYSPTVYLGKSDNTLNILYQNEVTSEQSGNTLINENITIAEFPIQSWTNLIISVSTKTVDVYINGKLVRSSVLRYPPNNPIGPLYLGKLPSSISNPGSGSKSEWEPELGIQGHGNSVDSYNGYIGTVKYYSDPISPSEAWDIYNKGYDDAGLDSNSLGKFKLKLSILDNNNEINSISL